MDYTTSFSLPTNFDPSITVTIRKPSFGDKILLDEATSEYRARVRDINVSLQKIEQQIAPIKRKFDLEKAATLRELRRQLAQASTDDQRDELNAQIKEAESMRFDEPVELAMERQMLVADVSRATFKIYNPALLRWGILSIEGLTIGGKPAGVDELIAKGPEPLVWELVSKIELATKLSDDDLKNSSLPSIFSGREDGNENSTTATSAENQSSTSPETAESPRPSN